MLASFIAQMRIALYRNSAITQPTSVAGNAKQCALSREAIPAADSKSIDAFDDFTPACIYRVKQ